MTMRKVWYKLIYLKKSFCYIQPAEFCSKEQKQLIVIASDKLDKLLVCAFLH